MRLIGLVAAIGLSVAACGTSGQEDVSIRPSDTGFVSGDGSVSFIAESDRGAPIEIAGSTIEGNEVELNRLATATVVNVWASWCAPCRAEAEVLNEVEADTEANGVRFLGVNVRDSKPAAAAFQRRFEVEYPSIFDPSSATLLAFGNTLPPNAIPSTIVLDQQNRVAARILGAVTAPTLRAVIDEVLGLNPVVQP
jgi:thiol-disulfide isomerase/thioredoxin